MSAKISSTTSEIRGMEIWLWCGFPVMVETTRSHICTKQINHATSRSQYFNENFYCKNCLRVLLTMTGKPAVRSLIVCYPLVSQKLNVSVPDKVVSYMQDSTVISLDGSSVYNLFLALITQS